MRPRLLPIAAVAFLVGLVMTLGCGDDGDANEPSATVDTSAPPREDQSRAASSEQASRGTRLVRVGTFDDPLLVTAPPGDRRRVFVIEQGGRVRLLLGGKKVARPFLDISGFVTAGGEQGLLGLAFAPDYERSGRFYVNFTDRRGDTRVQEFRRSRGSPNRADRSTRRPVLFVNQPFENHNGGNLAFGPDGLLYIGLGDGGSAGDPFNNAQRLGNLLGKILRIDPVGTGQNRYRIPSSNPFVGRGGEDEIYAYGLRNPWRFSFDRANGDLYIGDVGQNELEEIDYARRGGARGRNYGWSCFEGGRRYDESRRCPAATAPLFDYGRSNGECSVTGGVVSRDPGVPAMRGRYVYGDFCRGQLFSLRVSGGRAVDVGSLDKRVPSLSSFGEDARGRVYVVSLEGAVYRLGAR